MLSLRFYLFASLASERVLPFSFALHKSTMDTPLLNTSVSTDVADEVEMTLVPTIVNCNNGLTNGIVCRATPGNKNRFVFYLQIGETNEREQRMVLFVAQRQVFSKYYIYDVSETIDIDSDGSFRDESFTSKIDNRFVGKICRIRTPSNYVGYSLFEGRGNCKVQVQSVLYQIPKTLTWMKGESLRECHVVFSSKNSIFKSEGIFGSSETVDNGFEKDVKAILGKKSTMSSFASLSEETRVTTTKLPKYNKKTGSFTANFGGRCKAADQLNMQLADYSPNNGSGKVNLQMAMWTTDEYSLDFASSTMSSFQAFGYALAQFDL